ncbi:MAG: allantoate amidohydrolase [Chloroflexi bacterium OHK40]
MATRCLATIAVEAKPVEPLPPMTTTAIVHDLAATVMARCDTLGAISEEEGRLTRRSYTQAMRRANDQVAAWMRAAGMDVREDPAGTLLGHYAASKPGAPTLLLGSHLDSVRDAGRYDGPLGVLVGLAAVEQLGCVGRRLPFAVEVAAFADEEGLRFGRSYLGSMAFTGSFPPALLELRDPDGVRLADAIAAFGGDPARLGAAARRPEDLLAYLEVHIEQGPQLEARNLPLGVVSAIAGATRATLRFGGTAGHAGTVPMELRHDALCAAAQTVLIAEELARATPGLVATVGQIAALPGAGNVIPGVATISLDVRHQHDPARIAAVDELRARAQAAASARGVTLAWEELQSTSAVPMAPGLRARLARAIAAGGHTPLELPSGAGHDAAVLARFTDAAMLFVRCRGGISHHPAEAVDVADVAAAIAAVGRWIDDLAGEPYP